MASFLNYKICDNALECSGIEVCPVGAITFNDEKETIEIDNDKCISCGMCEQACPVGAFKVAYTKEDEIRIQKEIEEDPRTIKDLFVDRFGAAPISEFFQIDYDDIDSKLGDNITLVELYNMDEVACLLKSIPIKELTMDLPKDTLYYKVETKIKDKYEIKELPALLIFNKGKMVGKIEGYHTMDDKKMLKEKIEELVK